MMVERTSTRRDMLRGTGVAVGLAGVGVVGTVTAQESNGRLVFTYDDGPIEDYTQTFPVHRDEGVPGCSGIVTDRLGEKGKLGENHLREMSDAGWEMMSHTRKHRALARVPVTREVAADDTKLHVRSAVQARTPAPVRVWNGETEATADVAGGGEDAHGPYLALEPSLGTSFPADGTFVRFTDEVIRDSLATSKAFLEDRGYRVTGFVAPFGRYSDHVRSLVSEYYRAVPNDTSQGVNTLPDIEGLHLGRYYFNRETMTEAELGNFLDEVAARDAVGILGGHSQYESLDAERVRTAIRMAKKRNVVITTLREALIDMGAVEPLETPTPTTTSTPPPTDTPTSTPSRTSTDRSRETPTKAPKGVGIFAGLVGLGLARRKFQRG